MSDTRYTRTTVTLPENLLFLLKKRALEEKRTVKDLFTRSVQLFLSADNSKDQEKGQMNITELFGAWGKGPSGQTYLARMRRNKNDTARDIHLQTLWKQSS